MQDRNIHHYCGPIEQVGFNEIFQNFGAFKQAAMLVKSTMLEEIANEKKLIVDIEQISTWNHKRNCYLTMDVFRRGTMEVESRKFCRRYVQINILKRVGQELV